MHADSFSLKYKSSIIGNLGLMKEKKVKIAVPLKQLGNIWRTLEMPLINCEVELSLS